MAVPGILMRLVEPGTDQSARPSTIPPLSPSLKVEATYNLGANDGKTPSQNTLYFLEDISPLLDDSSAYTHDAKTNGLDSSTISWVICAFINGRDKSLSNDHSPGTRHTLPGVPAEASVVVVNGSTPQVDKVQDYHDWYDQEHGEKLTLVPGWNWARRYKLMKVYGDVETASFYGVNFYDEKNGLGGPVWQAGVATEWTARIRSNAAKLNIRRVWKVVDAGEA